MRNGRLLGLAALLLGLTARADYFSTVMLLNPVGYWRLDETNAPAADTASNLGTLGTAAAGLYLGGSTHPVPGALAGSADTAASFNGVSGEVGVPFSPALSLKPPFTVEGWVQPTQIMPANDPRAVLCCLNFAGAGRQGWLIYQTGAHWTFKLGNTNGYTGALDGGTVIQTGNWYHLAGVYDGTNATLYVNGAVDATGAVGSFTPNDAAPFEIAAAAAVGRFSPSAVDEVAVYTNALSSADILAHYRNGTNVAPATPYNQLVAAKNPLLYFRLDEPMYTPGSLPVAVNYGSLGAAVNGVYQPGSLPGAPGVPYTGLGSTNQACRFDGLPASVDLGADPGLNIQGPVTIIAWIKSDPAIRRFQDLISKGDLSWRLTIDEEGLPRFADGLDNVDLVGTFAVNDGKWHQLAGAYDGANLYLFVDGLLNATVATLTPIDGSAGSAAIGTAPDHEDRFFDGSIDEVAVFSSALTPQQILQIYQAANVPPSITQSPLSQIVDDGATVNFNVLAIGTPALAYQWAKNGTNLAGQTASSLVLNNVHGIDSGGYAVTVSNAFGVVSSSTAMLTVQSGRPVLFQQPQPLARYTGEAATFSVVAHGTAPLSYQWRLNGTPIFGATSAGYTLTNLQLTNAGDYSCTITNLTGATNSAAATLTLVSAPTDAYAAAVLADNPAAFWRLGETSGAVAFDYVGDHHGQYVNAVLGQPGYSLLDPDKAAAFGPGYNSYVAGIPGIDFATSSITASFSVEAWVKCPAGQSGNPDLPSNDVGIVSKGEGGGGEQFSLDLGSAGSYRFMVRGVDGNVQLANSSYPPDNTWQHVVGVCDEPGGQLHLYVNGSQQAVGPTSIGILATPHPVTIGSRQSGSGAYDLNLNGVIDEVAIYNYALSASQVTAHFNARYANNRGPAIGTPPASITNYVSLPTTLTVDAAGTATLAYQWKFNGADIPGASFSTLTIPALNPTNAGDYSVTVSNPFGTNSSAAAHLTVLPIPAAVDVSSNLVLHLKFDNDLVDFSGRGNNGTNVGATSFVPGEIGSGALHYSSDGVSSFNYVTLGLQPDLQFSSNVNFSVAYWVRVPQDSIPEDLPFFCNAANPSFFPGYDFCPGIDLNTFDFTGGWTWTLYDSTGGGAIGVGAPNSINDGNWHQLVHTFDRQGNAVTYLDSVPVDSRFIGHPNGPSIGNVDPGQPTSIGQDATGQYTSAAAVDLDDVGVWRRVLAPLEVAGMYVAGATNHVSFGTVPVRIAIQRLGSQAQISWPAGLLQSANQVGGPYADVSGAASPYLTTPSGSQKFYRVRQ